MKTSSLYLLVLEHKNDFNGFVLAWEALNQARLRELATKPKKELLELLKTEMMTRELTNVTKENLKDLVEQYDDVKDLQAILVKEQEKREKKIIQKHEEYVRPLLDGKRRQMSNLESNRANKRTSAEAKKAHIASIIRGMIERAELKHPIQIVSLARTLEKVGGTGYTYGVLIKQLGGIIRMVEQEPVVRKNTNYWQ